MLAFGTSERARRRAPAGARARPPRRAAPARGARRRSSGCGGRASSSGCSPATGPRRWPGSRTTPASRAARYDASELPDDPDEVRRIALGQRGARPHLAGGQAARRRGAPRRRPLRRDDRRRRQRRPRAQGLAARDRAGERHADGPQRRRRRARLAATSPRSRRWSTRGARSSATSSASSKLFVTKSAFAAFLVLSIGLTPTAYPLLPRQLSLVATLTVGIPGLLPRARAELGRVQPARLPARARRASRSRPGPRPGSASSRATCSR